MHVKFVEYCGIRQIIINTNKKDDNINLPAHDLV